MRQRGEEGEKDQPVLVEAFAATRYQSCDEKDNRRDDSSDGICWTFKERKVVTEDEEDQQSTGKEKRNKPMR